jgi:cytochrome c-type biogenesis protein CcmH
MIDETLHLNLQAAKAERVPCAILRAIMLALFAASLMGMILPLAPSASAQETQRAKDIGNKMLCVCGCNEILTACNHVGCTYSHAMLKEIDDRIARGDSDSLIFQSFVQEYGPKVLASPPASGFNLAAWIIPVVVPMAALLILWFVVRRWRERAVLSPAGGPPISAEFLSQARRESGRESDE